MNNQTGGDGSAHAGSMISTGSAEDLALVDSISVRYEKLRHTVRSSEEDARTREAEIKEYQALAQKHPHWPNLQYRLATQRIAYHRLEPQRFDELTKARDILYKLDEQLTDSTDTDLQVTVRFQLGRCLKHIGDHYLEFEPGNDQIRQVFAESIMQLKSAVHMDPHRIDALGEIILNYYTLDEVPAAVDLVRDHLPRVTDKLVRSKLLEMYGALLLDVDRADEAIAVFRQAIELNAQTTGSYLHLASIYSTRRDPVSQRLWLEKAADANPDFIAAHLRLGYLHMSSRDYPASIKSMEKALAVHPDQALVIGMRPSPALYRNNLYFQAASSLAWLYLQTGELQTAKNMVARATKFGVMESHLQDTLAMIHHARGETDTAIKLLKEIVNADDLPGSHYHLAVIYHEQGKQQEALAALNSALKNNRYFFNRDDAIKLKKQIEEAQP